jgi:hypothetical protein
MSGTGFSPSVKMSLPMELKTAGNDSCRCIWESLCRRIADGSSEVGPRD